ncbi:MAG: hypothetical protein NW200_01690 [Hyphomonadaceae bacterium]|nr:hypothetical protein [Hyphomonadaceae bacterium]
MAIFTDMPARPRAGPSVGLRAPVIRRGALVAGVALAVTLAFALGQPARALAADPDLARLLRGMAVLKAAIALAAGLAVWWRFGQPASWAVTGVYAGSVAAMAGVAGALWRLSGLEWISVLFHAALLAIAVTALRDGMGRRAP